MGHLRCSTDPLALWACGLTKLSSSSESSMMGNMTCPISEGSLVQQAPHTDSNDEPVDSSSTKSALKIHVSFFLLPLVALLCFLKNDSPLSNTALYSRS